VAPTGGPADTTPPVLVETAPGDGATNVAEPRLVLTFSERLDPASARAVTVVPEAEAPPDVSVRGREVEIAFPALRDSTTYVVTVGTDARDQRGVALRAPITVAFATGDAIDRGRIEGAVRDPGTGAAAAGLDVWAYAVADTTALPDPTAAAPDYRTQTGADGAFRLDYLRPGRYFVAAVADRNRNARADAGEPFAAPPRPALAAVDTGDSLAAAPVPADFWATTLDTVPPAPQRVRPASDRRLSVRFSEPVLLADTAAALVVADSASGREVGAAVYQPAGSPFEVFLAADAPLPPVPHRVVYRPGARREGRPALADSAGNAPAPFALSFTPPERPDTLVSRFAGFLPVATVAADSAQTLRPGERPGVRFTAPPDDLARVALVAGGERQPVAFDTRDGVRYTVTDSLPPAFALEVAGDDTTFARRYAVLDASETGGIVGRVEGVSAPVFVEVRQGGETVGTIRAEADGAFASGPLAPGDYRLRVVVDADGDGRWDGGALAPYRPPEPVRILAEPVNVRARWETEVPPIRLDAAAP
jgi:uncharacterized protein (DUF2141 family)